MKMRVLIIIIYIIYHYFTQLDLHSFPTRRSSDLLIPLQPAQCPVVPWPERLLSARFKTPWDEIEIHTVGIDRKSTRLNSSHQIISYAVFCLKKKKSFKMSSIFLSLSLMPLSNTVS